jgi:predicted aspartyl protease
MHQSAWALIDTGADECAFPANFASLMGHNLTLGQPSGIITGNGVAGAYSHTTFIEIFGLDALSNVSKNVVHTIPPAQIHYMQGLTTVLLGVQSFLSNFILTVDYSRKVFSVKTP